ncbi:hypothetical protein, partial [uncultured Alloprevotella sp.]|uniref:hypothetical protein n=1 Tax=uncultured Alloprevotella sp. TaxID=1283315 RepID=UPI00262A12FC
ASKNLQKSSAIQNISVTLFSVIMAIFVCNYLNVNTLKLQQISLITKFIDSLIIHRTHVNIACQVLGTMYHDVLGGNDKIIIEAKWQINK